jgi:hypothetical protein
MGNESNYPMIFQSGQVATICGLYEVVGRGYVYHHDEHTACEFRPGDVFPDFQGRAVCWHLVHQNQIEPAPEQAQADKAPELYKPWQ